MFVSIGTPFSHSCPSFNVFQCVLSSCFCQCQQHDLFTHTASDLSTRISDELSTNPIFFQFFIFCNLPQSLSFFLLTMFKTLLISFIPPRLHTHTQTQTQTQTYTYLPNLFLILIVKLTYSVLFFYSFVLF